MIGTRVSTRIGTRIGGGLRAPAMILPLDLAAAIVARFAASSLAGRITQIYKDQAGEKAQTPYLIFTVNSGSPILNTSTSNWIDQRIRFTVFADDSDAANQLREAVWAEFKGRSYDYQGGFSIPFFAVNRSEGKEAAKTIKNKFVFKAIQEVSARTCREESP